MDEIIISKAITESYTKELLEFMDVDVAIVGAGPSGLVASYYLAKTGVKTVLYERKLSVGGGMWGGGMMFNRIVFQAEAKEILDEFGVRAKEYQKDYYIADSLEAVSSFCSQTLKAGTRIFNLNTTSRRPVSQIKKTYGQALTTTFCLRPGWSAWDAIWQTTSSFVRSCATELLMNITSFWQTPNTEGYSWKSTENSSKKPELKTRSGFWTDWT